MATPQEDAKSDAAYWARPVQRLTVSDVPDGASAQNVDGRRLAGPVQGFGQMWQKTYQVPLDGVELSPEQVIAEWKKHFGSFWPRGNRFHPSITGIAPGEIELIDVSLPGKVRLATGVFVLYADDESFTFMTPEGHGFAGLITFSAFRRDDTTVAQVQLLVRTTDPLVELGLAIGFNQYENVFWQRTLTALAAHFGVDGDVSTKLVCLDPKRQWHNAGNIRYNATVRSQLSALGELFGSRPRG
jgi:hypothetical protein